MVSWNVRQHEREVEVTPTVTKLIPVWLNQCLSTVLQDAGFKMFSGTGNPNMHIAHFISRCRPVMNGPPAMKDALLLQLLVHSLEGMASHGMLVSREIHRQLAGDG